jgi:hypothetical protein
MCWLLSYCYCCYRRLLSHFEMIENSSILRNDNVEC